MKKQTWKMHFYMACHVNGMEMPIMKKEKTMYLKLTCT